MKKSIYQKSGIVKMPASRTARAGPLNSHEWADRYPVQIGRAQGFEVIYFKPIRYSTTQENVEQTPSSKHSLVNSCIFDLIVLRGSFQSLGW